MIGTRRHIMQAFHNFDAICHIAIEVTWRVQEENFTNLHNMA
jgi:hypothetical protein